MNTENTYEISYGKVHVPLYRVYATPLSGITAIPKSSFTGRENTLFALEVNVEVFGNNFLPAYTEGDNTNVVATDSMKNFVLHHALTFSGSTLEGFLDFLGRQFLVTYAQMERLRLTAKEIAFHAARVPQGSGFGDSNVLFKQSHDDLSVATIDFVRDGTATVITAHHCGRIGLQLFKITGSSFTHFVRDTYTTLPERTDRPLFIYLDVYWKYTDAREMVAIDAKHYIAAEQVRDVVQVVFHEFVSESIQHLVHEIGQRLLARFPQMAEVSFEAQNRTKDPVAISEDDPQLKVYSESFPAYGVIKLTLMRNS